jgi:hypothetical protein
MIRSLLEGDDIYQHPLWDLLMLELWHRAYIDAPTAPLAKGITSSELPVLALPRQAR